MIQLEHLIGLPWQLVKQRLQAASVPYICVWGENYNRFFDIAETGAYVARITEKKDQEGQALYEIIIYRPMVDSGFANCKEVIYAQTLVGEKSNS